MSEDVPFLPPRVGETSPPPPPPPRPATLPTGSGGPPQLPTAGAARPHVVPEHHADDALAHFRPTAVGTPVGPASGQVRLRSRSLFTITGIGLSLLVTAATIVNAFFERRELVRARDGSGLSAATAERLDERSLQLAIAWTACVVISGIVFLVWFSRAYRNLVAMRRNHHGGGWAIFAWFVPILNLFRPAQLMQELATASSRARRSSSLVAWWWAALWISRGVERGVRRLDSTSLDGLILQRTLFAATDLLWFVAGIVLIRLVRQVTQAQDAWFDPAV